MAGKQIINNTGKFSESSSSSNVKSLNNAQLDSATSKMSDQQSKPSDFMSSSLQFLDKHKMIIIGSVVILIIIYVGYGYYQDNYGNKLKRKNKKANKKKLIEDEQENFDLDEQENLEQEQENFDQDNQEQEFDEEQENFDDDQEQNHEYYDENNEQDYDDQDNDQNNDQEYEEEYEEYEETN